MLLLRYYKGMTQTQSAKVLGVSQVPGGNLRDLFYIHRGKADEGGTGRPRLPRGGGGGSAVPRKCPWGGGEEWGGPKPLL